MILLTSERDPERHGILILTWSGGSGFEVGRIGPRDLRMMLDSLGVPQPDELRALDEGRATIREWPAWGVPRALPGEGS